MNLPIQMRWDMNRWTWSTGCKRNIVSGSLTSLVSWRLILSKSFKASLEESLMYCPFPMCFKRTSFFHPINPPLAGNSICHNVLEEVVSVRFCVLVFMYTESKKRETSRWLPALAGSSNKGLRPDRTKPSNSKWKRRTTSPP